MTVTCDEFLTAVKRLITVPAQQTLLEDDDILALGTDVMRGVMTSHIMSVDEEYFITKGAQIPIEIGKVSYSIPDRSVARKLREIKIVDRNGMMWDFPMINLDRAHLYRNAASPFGFYFLGDRIELVSNPSMDGYYFVLYWPIQPGAFITSAQAGRVVSVAGNDITLDGLPSDYTLGVTFDVINGRSGNWYRGIDLVPTNITGSTITFAEGTVPAETAPGDYVTVRGTSPVLQIPDEAAPLLQHLTAVDVLGAISDFEGADRLQVKIKTLESLFLKLIAPRIDGEPKIILNDRGLLRGRSGYRNRSALFRG